MMQSIRERTAELAVLMTIGYSGYLISRECGPSEHSKESQSLATPGVCYRP
jgi:hypothetical protein